MDAPDPLERGPQRFVAEGVKKNLPNLLVDGGSETGVLGAQLSVILLKLGRNLMGPRHAASLEQFTQLRDLPESTLANPLHIGDEFGPQVRV